MNNTANTTDLEPLRNALATIGLDDLLDGFVSRERVGIRYLELSRVAAKFGLEFRHEHGNLHGKLKLEPINTTTAPALRLITRSDHAAVTGSRRAA